MDITDTTQVGVEASLRFYVDGLGFRRTNQWIHDGPWNGAGASSVP